MTEIQLNMYHALALGAAMYALGLVLTKKIPVFSRFCIPAPLVGGLCFAIFNTILYATGTAVITFDDTLQTVFMIFFFTTVGFTVSIPMLLKSGKSVIMLLILSVVMIILQNVVGSGVMALMGKDPLYGLACGSISMIGGPGTAAAFGPDLEAAGAVGGSVVSIAAATFGLVVGSLMGGPTAKRLIEKHDLRPAPATVVGAAPSAALATDVASEDERFISDSPRFVKGFMLLLLAVGIGNQVSVWLTALTGLTFPAYIGAMLVAVVVRNVMDGVHVSYPAEEIDTMGNMFLSIFLAMALAGLKLWELVDLAMPMVICLVLQCVVMFLFSYFVVFNVMGRNYDAAVMTAGFIGFSMGATSNAMANMQVVTKKYGPSPVAYFAIPMVGGMFIDFFNAVLIAANIGWWT